MEKMIKTAGPFGAFGGIDLLPRDDGHNLVSGEIYAANEARFTSVNYSEPLTAYTVGWRDPENLDAFLEQIAPAVEVMRRFEFKSALNAEAFLSEDDDVRAIGAAFKRVEYKGTTVNEKTLNKGLTIRIDHDDVVGDGWREQAVQRCLQRLQRNEVRRAVTAIDGASANTNKTWNNTTNPDGDMRDQLRAAADIIGLRPNVVLIGEAAWDLRASAYETTNTPYAARAGGMSPQELATKLMVDRVVVGKMRWQNAAATKAAIVGSVVYHFLAIPGVGKDDPSTIKRFVTPTTAGRYKVYVVEHEKFTDISVEHYSNVVITANLGVKKLTIS